MPGRYEPVPVCEPVERRPEIAVGELYHAVALVADEVVMVLRPAPAVAELAGVVRELVDRAGLREEGESPVDGREAEPLAASPKPPVQLLRRHVVALVQEFRGDGDALPRRPDPDLLEGVPRRVLVRHRVESSRRMRIILTIVVAVGLLPVLAGCGDTAEEPAAAADGQHVVASFYPLAYAAEQVAPDLTVTNLTPTGAEPHDLELSVRDVERVRGASVVLLLGGDFQPSVEEAASAAEGEVVEVLAGAEVEGGDPHVWLDPERYAEAAERIASPLGGDAGAFRERLLELDREFQRGLADCERNEIVVQHAAFGYLASAYGLEQIPIAGLAPEAESSAGDLREVARLIRERGIETVFVEPLAAPDEGETIARETGAGVATLNPIEGLTEAEAARGDDYFSLMRANLEALREALGCR